MKIKLTQVAPRFYTADIDGLKVNITGTSAKGWDVSFCQNGEILCQEKYDTLPEARRAVQDYADGLEADATL